MRTECKTKRMKFQGFDKRELVMQYDGGYITSDGGGVLLKEVDRRLGIIKKLAACFKDYRDNKRIKYSVEELLMQRIYGLALGYEDLNDHDELRWDENMKVLCREKIEKGKTIAGKSTLNRLELTELEAGKESRYKKILMDFKKVDDLFVEVFIKSRREVPEEIVLDLDATDDPLHGDQEGKFFHGYYKEYCYLPLYIFCGNDILCARLRKSNIDASEGSVEELERIVRIIRGSWPRVKIIIRGDGGFCREKIMVWCERNNVDYVVGLPKNSRLNEIIEEDMIEAEIMQREIGRASRVYGDFLYNTLKSWSKKRRVISKAEYLLRGGNPRFIVTSLSKDIGAKEVYEKIYCARGEMENRIKEQQLCLFADRTSTSKMRSNQIRLYFSSIAYMLVNALRRFGLKGTKMSKAMCDTIRLKLFKIGAQIKTTVRKVWVSATEGYPYKDIFTRVYKNLMAMPLLL